MSFLTFLVMILTLSVTERPSAQKKLSVFKSVYDHYKTYKNVSTDKLPDDFVVRTFEPEFIHLLLTLWIIGEYLLNHKIPYSDKSGQDFNHKVKRSHVVFQRSVYVSIFVFVSNSTSFTKKFVKSEILIKIKNIL